MKTRVITAVIGLPLLILCIYLGGASLYLVVFLISLFVSNELLRAYQIKNKGIIVIVGLATVIYYLILWFDQDAYFYLFVTVFMLSLLIYYVLSYPKLKLDMLAVSLLSFFYITYLISHIVLLREHDQYGLSLVWLVFIIGFGSDTFALLFGKLFGKHKLAKVLSPNKTVEGFFGGILGAVILTVAYGYFMVTNGTIELSKLWLLAPIGLVGSVMSQLGDLVASAIKRQTNIKDFGKILPGHGGVIDRFDSNIFTAPFVYYIMMLLFVQ